MRQQTSRGTVQTDDPGAGAGEEAGAGRRARGAVRAGVGARGGR